ncbi:MAG: ECF transporter S component [Bacilli bacterium]
MNKIKFMSTGAMLIAIIMVMSMVPQLGYIRVGLVDVTIIHIPVLIGAITFKNRNMAIVAGLSFGISSFLYAILNPTTPLAIVFVNPLVSILPRVLFALVAYYLYQLFTKLKINNYLSIVLATFFSVIFHTLSVLSMMYLFASDLINQGFFAFIWLVVTTNGIIELILALIIVPIIASTLMKALKIK